MRVFVLSLLLCVSVGCHAPVASVERIAITAAAPITEVRFPSRSIGGLLCYRIIVPATIPGERLPVLYFLHGANSSPAEVEQLSAIVNLAAASRLIVVIPEAENSYYSNAKYRRHARWEDAITQDLPRDVESRFPALTSREHRGIAGISMGGYGAVKLALKHPDLYAFVGTMSGALDITRRPPNLRRWGQTFRIWSTFGLRRSSRNEEDVFALLEGTPNLQSMKWFTSCGRMDPLFAVNGGFSHRLRERGITPYGVTTLGGHGWQSWNEAMPLLFKAAKDSLS